MKTYLAKIIDGEIYHKRVDSDDTERIAELGADGYKTFVQIDPPALESETQSVTQLISETDDQITAYFEIVDNDPSAIADQITRLKAELTASDYKWRKISEAQYRGIELPYDIEELIDWSENIRAQINELELKLQ